MVYRSNAGTTSRVCARLRCGEGSHHIRKKKSPSARKKKKKKEKISVESIGMKTCKLCCWTHLRPTKKLYLSVCVCFLLVSERTEKKKKAHHSPETSNNNKVQTHTHTDTHTHVDYTITPARFLAIDDRHGGGIFLSQTKKTIERQPPKHHKLFFFVFLLSYSQLVYNGDDKHLLGRFDVFRLFRMCFVHWLSLPRRCQLSFLFFFSRLKSTEQSITSQKLPLLQSNSFSMGRQEKKTRSSTTIASYSS